MNAITRMEDVRMSDIQPTKFGIELLADAIAESIKDGHTEPIAVAVKMTALEQLAKEVRDRIKDDVASELTKHPKAKAEILGASVSQMETIRYDYSHITEWAELDSKIKELTERKKAIEEEEKKWRRGELPVHSVTQSYKIALGK